MLNAEAMDQMRVCGTAWTCLECGAENPISNVICGSAACQLTRLNAVSSAMSNGASATSNGPIDTTLREGSKDLKNLKPQRNKTYLDPQFLRFWEVYPLKRGKLAASKSWQRVMSTGAATADEVIEAALRYRNDPTRDPDKTKYPQGWLNDGRYLDEGPSARPEAHEIRETDWEAMRAADDARIAALLAEEGA